MSGGFGNQVAVRIRESCLQIIQRHLQLGLARGAGKSHQIHFADFLIVGALVRGQLIRPALGRP